MSNEISALVKNVSSPHFFEIEMTDSDIDELGHVNNAVYLRWLMDAAKDHADHLGFSQEKFLELGSAFFVTRNEIDYLWAGDRKDKLVVATWCGEIKKASATRHYEIFKLAKGSDKARVLVRAKTNWAFVEIKSGKPKRIPPEMLEAFQDQTVDA